jgi:nucleotide-binding universal stress UspA family protein
LHKLGDLKQLLDYYTAARSHNREVDHVPAYSHSNRWIGVGGTCSDERVVIGQIRGSQDNSNYRRGAVRLAQRSRNENLAAAALDKLAEHKEQVEKHTANVLSRAADAAKQAGVPCDTMRVANASPYQAIIATASDRGCDLIAMTSHGRGGLSAVVLGSVTNKVLTHTKIPVLVYR